MRFVNVCHPFSTLLLRPPHPPTSPAYPYWLNYIKQSFATRYALSKPTLTPTPHPHPPRSNSPAIAMVFFTFGFLLFTNLVMQL